MSDPTRIYTNGEITVEWRPELCIHCQSCAESLPKVFKPQEKPWVDMSEGTTEEIRKTVEACPSKALSLKS